MSKFSVSEKIIRWAIERKGLKVSDLSKKFPKIQKWLDGSDAPTIKQLETLSKATSTPLGYFFMQEPPNITLHIPHFRTLDDGEPKSPSTDLIETVQSMELRQSWYKDHLINRGAEELNYVGSLSTKSKPHEAASMLRSVLHLPNNWASSHSTWGDALKALRNSMENVGILVIVNGIVGNNTSRPLSVDEFRGFVLCDTYAPLVFINGADSKAAQMFTLAHELVHVFLGKSAAFDLKNLQPSNDHSEKFCNEIAAEFLVPKDEFQSLWTKVPKGNDAYKILGQRFKVSQLVIARRALDLQLITKKSFFSFYEDYITQLNAMKAKATGGGDFYASQNLRVGKSFGDFIVNSVKEGSLLYSDAYRLTGLSGASFEKFANIRNLKKTGSD